MKISKHTDHFDLSRYKDLSLVTHAEVSQREVQIPGLDRHGDDNHAKCIKYGDIPSTFLVIVGCEPKANDFHVNGRHADG